MSSALKFYISLYLINFPNDKETLRNWDPFKIPDRLIGKIYWDTIKVWSISLVQNHYLARFLFFIEWPIDVIQFSLLLPSDREESWHYNIISWHEETITIIVCIIFIMRDKNIYNVISLSWCFLIPMIHDCFVSRFFFQSVNASQFICIIVSYIKLYLLQSNVDVINAINDSILKI